MPASAIKYSADSYVRSDKLCCKNKLILNLMPAKVLKKVGQEKQKTAKETGDTIIIRVERDIIERLVHKQE